MLILVSALCAQIALASYSVELKNNAGKTVYIFSNDNQRTCYCLTNTQTASIRDANGGDIKVFSTSDCTGNYGTPSNGIVNNAQWVNSISFGKGGIPSQNSPWGCANFYDWA